MKFFPTLYLAGSYSPRDAGNFAAGAVAQSSGMEGVAQFGYGAYNLSGNNKKITGAITYGVAVYFVINPMGAIQLSKYIMNGEDKLTQMPIDLGKKFIGSE